MFFAGGEYSLSAVEFQEEFFDIHSLGFHPTSLSTACWRGYVAGYAVYKNHLVLNKLYTNNGNDKDFEIPAINGKMPEIESSKGYTDEYKDTYKRFTYKYLKLKIDYTGSLIITKDFIQDMYVHMGFQSPISYETVIMLTFIDGKLILTKDISDIAKKMRGTKKKMTRSIFEYYDLSFDKQAKDFISPSVKKQEKSEIYDAESSLVIPAVYGNVTNFQEGVARVNTYDKLGYDRWGFIDKSGKEIFPLVYDDVESFSEGMAAVEINGKWGFVARAVDSEE